MSNNEKITDYDLICFNTEYVILSKGKDDENFSNYWKERSEWEKKMTTKITSTHLQQKYGDQE